MAPLTARQMEIAALVAEGLLEKHIAFRLGVTDGTVKSHIGAIFKKLSILSRGRLALWYLAQADEAERERLFATVRRP